jgi:hypothetical protein
MFPSREISILYEVAIGTSLHDSAWLVGTLMASFAGASGTGTAGMLAGALNTGHHKA